MALYHIHSIGYHRLDRVLRARVELFFFAPSQSAQVLGNVTTENVSLNGPMKS
jgi:hypothetical protein